MEYLLPSLEGITPAVTEDVFADPSSTSTVEVEVVRGSMDDFVARLSDGCSICGGNPDPVEKEGD